MKKVLFVITKSNWGGAQRYVYDLATNLPTDRFEPIVAFGGTGSAGSEEGELAYRLREAKLETRFIRAFARDIRPLDEIRACLELYRLFRKERPDVVHLNSSKAGALGALAARIAGVPKIIFTAHGWAFREHRSVAAQFALRIASWVTALLAHTVICVSEFDSRDARAMLGIGRKVLCIHNGIRSIDLVDRTSARANVVPPEIAARHADAIWVVTNAELHLNKNLSFAIDAVTRYNETHPHGKQLFYVIIGAGEQRAQLEKDIERRRVKEHVFLAGFLPAAPRLLRAFDIFFLPSRKEGLPYVLLEAGFAELAVIASNVGGIPEIVTDGKNGLLASPDDATGFLRNSQASQTTAPCAKNLARR